MVPLRKPLVLGTWFLYHFIMECCLKMLLILQNVFLETAVEWENSHFSITLEQEIKDIHVHAICYKCEVSHRFIYRFYIPIDIHTLYPLMDPHM